MGKYNSHIEHNKALLLVLIVSFGLITNQWIRISPNASPMWDEAYYLWVAQKFASSISNLGFIDTFIRYRSVKPWLMELLLSPLVLSSISDVRVYLIPSCLAALFSIALFFQIASHFLERNLAALLALSLLSIRMFYFHTFSTQTEIFSCFAILLGLFAALKPNTLHKLSLLVGSCSLLLLAKQSNIVAIVAILLVNIALSTDRLETAKLLFLSCLGACLFVAPTYWYNWEALFYHAKSVSAGPHTPLSIWLSGYLDSIGPIFIITLALVSVLAIIRGAPNNSLQYHRSKLLCLALLALGLLLIFSIVIGHNPVKYFFPYTLFALFLVLISLGQIRRKLKLDTNGNKRLSSFFRIAAWGTLAIWCFQIPLTSGGDSHNGFINDSMCIPEALAVLAEHSEELSKNGAKLIVIGDNSYLNYSSLSWLLERAQVPSSHLSYQLPLRFTQEINNTKPYSLVFLISLRQGRNLIPAAQLNQARLALSSSPKFDSIHGCRHQSGLLEIFELG